MPRSTELRERAGQALQRAREIETREAESDEPLPAADHEAHAAALQEAADLSAQADQIDARANASAAAERALQESQRRASTPPVHRGRSPVNETDSDGFPMPRSNEVDAADEDGPPIEGYSIMRAVRGYTRALLQQGSFNGLEREWHDHLRQRKAGGAQGLIIPWNAPLPRSMWGDVRRRDLTTSTGSGAIPNDLVPTFLDLLRAKLVLTALGVKVINATHKFWYPKKTAGTTGYWVGEGVAVTESDITIGQVAFDPKTVGASTTLSRKFLLQNEVGGEDMAIDDIAQTIGQTVEKAAINGSGSSAQPLGILQNSNVPTIAIGTNGGPLTWALLTQMANKPDTQNAPMGNKAFLFNPLTVGAMAGAPRVSGYPKFLYDVDVPNSPVAGFNAISTTNVPANLTKGSGTNLAAAIFGAWNQLAVVFFSGLDLIVNPFTEDREGNVRITMFQDVDVNVLYPEAFVKVVDITTSAWA